MATEDTQVPAAAASAPATPSLKYLGFVPYAYVQVVSYVTSLYKFAKDSSGPLKPGVDSVEGTVKTVVGPVYQKISGVPSDLLVFADQKVDYFLHFLDGHLPQNVKDTGLQAFDIAKGTVSEVQTKGLIPTAKDYYEKYEPVAETYGVKAYKEAIKLPLVPQAVSITRYGALKVNDIIVGLKNNGFPLAAYIPILPVTYFDKITQQSESSGATATTTN